jgi:hypothetical protein
MTRFEQPSSLRSSAIPTSHPPTAACSASPNVRPPAREPASGVPGESVAAPNNRTAPARHPASPPATGPRRPARRSDPPERTRATGARTAAPRSRAAPQTRTASGVPVATARSWPSLSELQEREPAGDRFAEARREDPVLLCGGRATSPLVTASLPAARIPSSGCAVGGAGFCMSLARGPRSRSLRCFSAPRARWRAGCLW